MEINRLLRVLSVIGVSMLACWGTKAGADPFFFQGQLKDGGQPANGIYDLNFQLHSSSAGGVPVGAGVGLQDVVVVDGLFTVELNFSTAYVGEDRWIQIFVRDGDSVGPFSTLSPRQPMLATPEAQHAKTADALVDPDWFEVDGNLRYGAGADRMYINRDGPITFSEYFGFHADTSGFVGMTVSGLLNSNPYYGYTTNGQLRSYTYYSSSTNSWSVWHNGADRLRLDTSGHLFAQNVTGTSFRFTTPKTQFTSVSGNVFSSGSGDYVVSFATGGAYMEDTGFQIMVAPVSLPDGAVVKRMTAYIDDTAPGDLSVTLSYQGHGGGVFTTIAGVDTNGLTGTQLILESPAAANLDRSTIDHQRRHYHLRAFSTSWPGNFSMTIKSVLIEYTVDEAD